jgi:hypothetical protein
MTARKRLPDRRLSITRRGVWQNDTSEHRFHVTLGIHPETGEVLEVFYADGQRTGSGLQHAIQDACVLVSLLLQHGVSPEAIGKSLSTMPVWGEDKPATVIGVIVQIVKEGLGPDAPEADPAFSPVEPNGPQPAKGAADVEG